MKKVLIIDDNELNLKILGLILKKAKYNVDTIVNPKYALDEIVANPPDIILLDISMPEIDGFKLCSLIKHNEKVHNIPVIFLTMHSSPEFIVRGFEYGAVDYITKPYNAEEIKVRLATHLKIQELQNKLYEITKLLEQKVHEQVIKISDTQMEMIYSLAKLAQSRESGSKQKIERIRRYCYILVNSLQKNPKYSELIDEKFVKNIFSASPLYDIGKVGIPDRVLLYTEKYSEEDFEIMKKHTLIGYDTLNEVLQKFGDNKFIEMGAQIARSHHEHWDGTGYPDMLKGEEIPLSARIISILDTYDALTTQRNYKKIISHQEALDIIKSEAGKQFDSNIVEEFINVAEQISKVNQNDDELV